MKSKADRLIRKRAHRKPGHVFETLPLYGSQSVSAEVLSGPVNGRYSVRLFNGITTTVPAWEIE